MAASRSQQDTSRQYMLNWKNESLYVLTINIPIQSEFNQDVLIGWDPAPQLLPHPPHLGSYTRALLVSQDRRHLPVSPWLWVIPFKSCIVCERVGEEQVPPAVHLDFSSLFGLHVHSWTHWLRPRNPHPPSPAFGRYWSAKIDDISLWPPVESCIVWESRRGTSSTGCSPCRRTRSWCPTTAAHTGRAGYPHKVTYPLPYYHTTLTFLRIIKYFSSRSKLC